MGAARVILGVGLLAWVLSRTGMAIFGQVLDTPWLPPFLVSMTLLGLAVEAERLRVLCAAAGLELPRAMAYRLVPVGTFFNFCIPGGTGGDVVKLFYLARNNRSRGVESATILLLDRVVALVAVLTFVLTMAVLNRALVSGNAILSAVTASVLVALAIIVTVISLAFSARIREAGWYRRLLGRLPFSGTVTRIVDAVYQFRQRKRALLDAALISLAGHIAGAATYVVTAAVLLPSVPWTAVAFLSMTGMVANALPITPGGLGVGETAFERLFALVGATGGAALLILWRASMIPMAAVGATLYITGRVSSGIAIDPAAPAAERVPLVPGGRT